MSLKHDLALLLKEAIEDAQRRDILPPAMVPDIVLERPQHQAHGDLASSIPLKLARAMRLNPVDIAERLVPLIPPAQGVEQVWAAPPGFINFSLTTSWLTGQVDYILAEGQEYGRLDLGEGKRMQIEFVSVNPTGPLHVGHIRGAVLGSTLARVLPLAGYQVEREYYVNDGGNQIDLFYQSLYVRYLQALDREAEMPDNGYVGAYVVDLAQEIIAQEGDRFLSMPQEEATQALGEIGLQRVLQMIREDLARVGVEFDVWFSERSLYQNGQYDKVMELLRKSGYLSEREGALWFKSTALGEEKDEVVLIRKSGAPTYFASDAAYHYNKFIERGFQSVVNIWGADHQGHVPRMKAMVSALGVDPERLTILICQLVTLKRGEEVVRASKRTGEMVTLRELLDEVGPDACRYFFLSRSAESQMEFDLDLAVRQSSDNPVYYIQYAHARIASILRLAQEQGIDYGGGDVSLLVDPAELDLIRKMVQLPDVIETISVTLEPQHLPYFALELATAFHWFYQQCRVVSSAPGDAEITRARLKLVEASQTVLARCLSLMGMSAPEQM